MRWRWLPMSWAIPAMLFVLTLIAGGLFYWIELDQGLESIEQKAVHDLSLEMHRSAAFLEYALTRADVAAVDNEVANLATLPALQAVLLVDPDDRITAATRRAWIGQHVGALDFPLLDLISQTRTQMRGHIHLASDGHTLWAHYPVHFAPSGGKLRSGKPGVLIARMDLAVAQTAVRHDVGQRVWLFVGFLANLAFLVWVASHFALTRRMRRIIRAARAFADGHLETRIGMKSRDELGRIGEAFDKMAARLQLAASEQAKLSKAVEHMDEGMIITDHEGTIEYVNPAFSRITGYTPEEAIGQNPRILKSGEHPPEFYQAFWKRISSGKPWRGRMVDRRKDGTLYNAQVSVAPVLDAGGEVTHYVGVQEDVSEQLRLEEQFRQAQKMESVGTLVGGIAHDFNNMLAGMLGNLYLAKKRAADMPDIQKSLERVEKLGYRSADMIKQLLAFARRDPVQFQVFDLSSFIKEAYKLAKVGVPENIGFEIDFDEQHMRINGDPTQVQQMLMNLLGNARDALADQPEPMIHLALQRYHPDRDFSRRHQLTAPAYARLTVRDNGPGIPKQIQDRIFEPFFTTKEVGSGSGLGLAMIYGAMQRHGGIVEVESREGEGAAFHLYFPLTDDEAIEASEHGDQALGMGERLLLADDEAVVRDSVGDLLTASGYRVTLAVDGQAALECFIHDPQSFDAVVLDVVMPRMGGVEAALKMRDIRPDVPIIFATGYDREHVLAGTKGMHRVASLSKPVHPAMLQQVLDEMLRGDQVVM